MQKCQKRVSNKLNENFNKCDVRGFRLFGRDSNLGIALTFISAYCEMNKTQQLSHGSFLC